MVEAGVEIRCRDLGGGAVGCGTAPVISRESGRLLGQVEHRPGQMPSTSVPAAVDGQRDRSRRRGTATVGPSAAGGEKYMSTMTRR